MPYRAQQLRERGGARPCQIRRLVNRTELRSRTERRDRTTASTSRPRARNGASGAVEMPYDGVPKAVGRASPSSCCARPVRHPKAPAATGSSTHGVPACFAPATARCIAPAVSSYGVPRLTSTPPRWPRTRRPRGGCRPWRERADGEQDVGGPPRHDDVGQALDQRGPAAQCGEGNGEVLRGHGRSCTHGADVPSLVRVMWSVRAIWSRTSPEGGFGS